MALVLVALAAGCVPSNLDQIDRVIGLFEPTASPYEHDGSRIAFASTCSGQRAIYSVNPDGSDLRRLTHYAPYLTSNGFKWSPDGSHIVLNLRNRIVTLPYNVGAETLSEPQTVVDGFTEFTVSYPGWSADGQRIIFGGLTTSTRHLTLYSVNTDGSDMRTHTDALGEALAPAPRRNAREIDAYNLDISPDGTRAAYVEPGSLFGFPGAGKIYVLDVHGLITRVIDTDLSMAGFIGGASWSPDGSRIGFYREITGTRGFQHVISVFTVKPNGADMREVLSVTLPGYGRSLGTIGWSPDGTHLAWSRSGEIYVVDIEEGRMRTIVDHPGGSSDIHSVSWSPVLGDPELVANGGGVPAHPDCTGEGG